MKFLPACGRVVPLLTIALAFPFMGPIAYASTVVVGTCLTTYPSFTTIQAAVNAVPAESVIDVCPGTYAEQVTITQKVTINGYATSSGQAPIIVPPKAGLVQNGTDIFGNPVAAQIYVGSTAGSVTMARLTVDGTGNNLVGCDGPTLIGIYYQGASGTITESVVRNQFQTDFAKYGTCSNGLAIEVESLTSSAVVNVSYNTIRAYQKNGITATGAATGAGAAGPVVNLVANYITGMAANSRNWSTPGVAENGIQVGFGASGKITGNTINDNVWPSAVVTAARAAASGILVFASSGVLVSENFVGSAQYGIVTETDSTGQCTNSSGTTISCGTADRATITGNRVTATQIFDSIDVCSNDNSVTSNSIYGASQSGIHLDNSCTNTALATTSGNTNSLSKNIVNEGCAGVLTGTGTGNTVGTNSYFNVSANTMTGNSCSVAVGMAANPESSAARHTSPYFAGRR